MKNLKNIHLINQDIKIDEIKFQPHPKFKGIYIKKLINDKIEMLLVKLEKNAIMETHIHEDKIEIHQVISGEGLFKLETKEIKYEQGIFSVIPNKTPHSIIALSDLYILAFFS
ncbi:MAG: Cupin domain protein [Alphaproteobacteria bacterium ADurb.Bin438]|nr:MAG: Cupin domain protein [Alphaproteobacteria bacterium ADurb.Bin438]